MKVRKVNVSELHKLVFLLIVTGFGLACLVLFQFKLPSTNDFRQDTIKKDIETISMKDGVIYEQVFQCDVDRMNTISVLMINDSATPLAGKIIIESFDAAGNLVASNTHDAMNIPPVNYVANLIYEPNDSSGNMYTLKVRGEGIGNDTGMKLAVDKAQEGEYGYSSAGVTHEEKLMLSYVGKKDDKTYYWYLIMLAVILLPLYAMVDYSKIKRRKK